MKSDPDNFDIAVVIPCHNEVATIRDVVSSFQRELPMATITVADNASTDGTSDAAKEAGARVLTVKRVGKGRAVRQLFSDVEADCYVLVDGDATYDPTAVKEMVPLVLAGNDMVVAIRAAGIDTPINHRRGHRAGNATLSWIFAKLFDFDEITDTLSGYRAMSRRFVKSFPVATRGFEIEAELNAHAATLEVPVAEVRAEYRDRPEGSTSKLSTYKDGLRILRRNAYLARDARPSLAFGVLSLPWLILAAICIGIPVFEYLETGLVRRFPTLIAGVACLVAGITTLLVGIVLQRSSRNRIEATRLAYLGIVGPLEAVNKCETRPETVFGGLDVSAQSLDTESPCRTETIPSAHPTSNFNQP